MPEARDHRLTFIRHGKPRMRVLETPWKWMNAQEINACMDAYDSVHLDMDWCNRHNRQVDPGHSLSSDLIRALETARLMTGAEPEEISPLFREVPLPRFKGAIRLPAVVLAALSRLGWYFGWMDGEETRAQTRARIQEAANLLEDRIQRHRYVTLFAHGFFLWLLMAEMQKRGWQSDKQGPFRYMEEAHLFKSPTLAKSDR